MGACPDRPTRRLWQQRGTAGAPPWHRLRQWHMFCMRLLQQAVHGQQSCQHRFLCYQVPLHMHLHGRKRHSVVLKYTWDALIELSAWHERQAHTHPDAG